MTMPMVFALSIKKRLLVFFFLVFIVSWGAVLMLAGPSGFPIKEEQAMVVGMAILLGPSIVASIFIALSGKVGIKLFLSRLLKWRVGVRWYAIAFLIAPLSTVVTLGLLSLFSAEFQPNILMTPDKSSLIISAIFAGLVVGLFEEVGWTGVATHKLLETQSVVGTGLIIGTLWGVWHFPLFWQANSFTASLPFVLLVARLISWLPPYRVLMVWVYKNTESLFVVVLMHTSLVSTLMILDPPIEGESLVNFILVRAMVLWVAVSMVVAVIKKRT